MLADALALADEEEPDSIFVFATLTGAARVALGPDLPAFFTDDEHSRRDLPPLAASIGDPLWRLPLWDGYERHLDSEVADMNNVWESPFAGAITAALFLKRFVSRPAVSPISISTAGGRRRDRSGRRAASRRPRGR